MSENIACAVCDAPAQRSPLASGDGYLYACDVCGGLYEIGAIAARRADAGTLHPDVVAGVRRFIEAGQLPRVEHNADGVRIVPLAGRTQPDRD